MSIKVIRAQFRESITIGGRGLSSVSHGDGMCETITIKPGGLIVVPVKKGPSVFVPDSSIVSWSFEEADEKPKAKP